MSTNTVRGSIDTEGRQAHTTTNYQGLTKIGVRGTGSSLQTLAWFYMSMPFRAHKNVKVHSATLRLRLAGAWSGTNNLTAKRITGKWAESTATYANPPSTSATHSASKTVTGGADKDVCDFDVKDMLQDFANGSPYFGFQVALSQNVQRYFYSTEYGTATYRPELIVTWSIPPNAPTGLAPDGDEDNTPPGDAVSVEWPVLSWKFSDNDGTSTQAQLRVQLSATDDFVSPDYDTGWIAGDDSQWDTNDGVFTGIVNGTTWYWRVAVENDGGDQSTWSDVAVFNRTNLSSLTLDSPGVTTGDLSPTAVWTFGGTQDRWALKLYRVETSGAHTLLWWQGGSDAGTSTFSVPSGHIVNGKTYILAIYVWDDVVRYLDQSASAQVTFTYVPAGVPDPVSGFTVTQYVDGDGLQTAAVQIAWTRADAPDYWCLAIDGVEVKPRVSVADTHVSGDNYRLIWWGAHPRVTHTYSVEAVVNPGTGVYEHSHDNPTQDFTNNPIAIWLVDDTRFDKDPGTFVGIYGNDAADFKVAEQGTTYQLISARAPVRIIDVVRGYEGTITGVLLSSDDRDSFTTLKGLDQDLRLIVGDLNLPVRLEEATLSPTPSPGDFEFNVSFPFFQTGAPWPVTQEGD